MDQQVIMFRSSLFDAGDRALSKSVGPGFKNCPPLCWEISLCPTQNRILLPSSRYDHIASECLEDASAVLFVVSKFDRSSWVCVLRTCALPEEILGVCSHAG